MVVPFGFVWDEVTRNVCPGPLPGAFAGTRYATGIRGMLLTTWLTYA